MGDRDTREDAVRLATESAKRNALEQVATYLESVTVVDGMDITKDEIRTYTAGLVIVLDQRIGTTLDGETIVVKVNLLAQIDTEEVAQAIATLRENEDARAQLAALKSENEQLQQELDAANQALGTASTLEQTQEAAQRRQDILNRVQSNAMISQVWTDWVLVSPVVYSHSWMSSPHALALLANAQALYPGSPHVGVAQRVIAGGQPLTPPSPPQPPAPGSAPPRMPTYEVVSSPGSSDAPRTLNEITHRTPTRPAHISNETPVEQGPGARHRTDAHRPNLFLPLSAGQPMAPSRSMPRTKQFLEQNGRFGQAPGSDGHPPAPRFSPREGLESHSPAARQFNPGRSPMMQPAPRVPSQVAPRSFGGGDYRGGGAMEGRGGRGQGQGRGGRN
jgi:regulator of replication initiation timing